MSSRTSSVPSSSLQCHCHANSFQFNSARQNRPYDRHCEPNSRLCLADHHNTFRHLFPLYPPKCTKRASVALIIRIRPTYSHWPSSSTPNSQINTQEPISRQLNNFFSQQWSRHGDPEILFIKRAARSGDRWTSHVALPGGKRDPEDVDDKATAVRETIEEVGIDLSEGHALFVGNLPERVVTTSWGKVPYVEALS